MLFCHNTEVPPLIGYICKEPKFMATRSKTVAVVDDDLSMLSATDNLLSACGFSSIKFSSAEEFLDSGCAGKVDCLLLDIHLPGMSGVTLWRQLYVSHPHLPIILMTALDDDALRQQAIGDDPVTVLRKPFPSQQLIDAIERPGSKNRNA